ISPVLVPDRPVAAAEERQQGETSHPRYAPYEALSGAHRQHGDGSPAKGAGLCPSRWSKSRGGGPEDHDSTGRSVSRWFLGHTTHVGAERRSRMWLLRLGPRSRVRGLREVAIVGGHHASPNPTNLWPSQSPRHPHSWHPPPRRAVRTGANRNGPHAVT